MQAELPISGRDDKLEREHNYIWREIDAMNKKREMIPRKMQIILLVLCAAGFWYYRETSRIEARSFNRCQTLYQAFGYALPYEREGHVQKVLYSQKNAFLQLQPLYIRLDLSDEPLRSRSIYVSRIANPDKWLKRYSFDLIETRIIQEYEIVLKYALEKNYRQSVGVQFETKKDGYYIYGMIRELPGRIINEELVLEEQWERHLMNEIKAVLLGFDS